MDASRFDALARTLAADLPRRRLLRGIGALGLGALLARSGRDTAARPMIHPCQYEGCARCCCSADCKCYYWCSSGVAGAGLVETGAGGATFAFFASRIAGVEGAIRGHVWWEQLGLGDRSFGLSSTRIEAYGPLPDDARGRMIRGVAVPYGPEGDEAPFLVHVHVGAEGEESRVRVWAGDAVPAPDDATPVGAALGFAYEAEGPVRLGSLTLLKLDQPVPENATPTG